MEFASLAHTFEELERTSSRLTLIGLLTDLFRSIERPAEIEQVCYLVQGRVAPFFEALEMGMAEKSVARSIAMAYHTTVEHVEALKRAKRKVNKDLFKEVGKVWGVGATRASEIYYAERRRKKKISGNF